MLSLFCACGDKPSSPPAPQTYTITFKQELNEDTVFTVEKGKDFDQTKTPIIVEKTGYDGAWEQVDLTNVNENKIVNAIYTPKTFTVTLNANGGVVVEDTFTIDYNSELNVEIPVKSGATFMGWFDGQTKIENGLTFTRLENLALTAKWGYKVKFVQDGKQDEFTVIGGESFDTTLTPELQQKTGYDVSWENKNLNAISENVTVNAIYTAKTYTITLNTNGGVIDGDNQVQVTFDTEYSLSEPTKEGFAFTGWFYNESQVAKSGKWAIADSVTLVAGWQLIPANSYTITFIDRGIVLGVFHVTEGQDFDLSLVPQLEGVTGYDVAWENEDLTAVTENKTIIAEYTPKTYTITFFPTVGSLVNIEMTVTYDCYYEITSDYTPTAYGFDFLGWYEGTELFPQSGVWKRTEDVILTAQWQELTTYYTIYFTYKGQIIRTYDVFEGEDFPEGMRPTVGITDGYTIVWSHPEGTLTNVREDIWVSVESVANTYTVTYDTNGGQAIEDGKFTFDAPYEFETPVRENCEFLGWYYNGEYVYNDGIEWKFLNDITLVAKWGCIITFDHGDNITETFVVPQGETFTQSFPSLFERVGYNVVWEVESLGVVNESRTIRAIYTPQTYKITLDANGGSVQDSTVTMTYEGDYQLEQPVYEGYTFLGWYEGSSRVDDTGVWYFVGEYTLVARWEEIQIRQVAICFLYQDNEVALFYVDEGSDFSQSLIPVMPVKFGYDFIWQIEEGVFNDLSVDQYIVGDYVARQTSITFNANGGTVAKQEDTFTFAKEYAMPTPEKFGAQFMGWYFDGQKMTQSGDAWGKDVAQMTVVAKWAYTVRFVQENGESSFVVEENTAFNDALTPILTAKLGYNVVWEEKDLSNITSNVTVNAIYTAKKYVVTFNTAGGNTIDSCEFTYNEEYVLPVATRDNYHLKEWIDQDGNPFSSSGVWTIDKTNITLTAVWGFGVTFNYDNGEQAFMLIAVPNSVVSAEYFEAPTKDGMHFVGWYDENGEKIDLTSDFIVTENTSVFAKWGYKVTFLKRNNTVQAEFLVIAGQDFDTSLTPEVEKATGIDLAWESIDLTNINEDKVVKTIRTDDGPWSEFI